VALVERDELCRAQTSDRTGAAAALLSEEVSEAVGTVRLLLPRRELFSSQLTVAARTREALAVPWRVLVRDASLVDHSIALETPLGVLLLIARDADSLRVTWYERLRSYWLTADLAAKALLVKLLSLELVLLHACAKDSLAGVTAQSKVLVMAIGAEGLVVPTGERPVDQRVATVGAVEASLVPMLLLV